MPCLAPTEHLPFALIGKISFFHGRFFLLNLEYYYKMDITYEGEFTWLKSRSHQLDDHGQ